MSQRLAMSRFSTLFQAATEDGRVAAARRAPNPDGGPPALHASPQHDLTGQRTHFSQAPRIWIGLTRSRVVAEPLEPCPSLMRLAVGYARMSVLSPTHPNWVGIRYEDCARDLGGRTVDQNLSLRLRVGGRPGRALPPSA
jgi:hypothetical protein